MPFPRVRDARVIEYAQLWSVHQRDSRVRLRLKSNSWNPRHDQQPI